MRQLDTTTLENYGRYIASCWLNDAGRADRNWCKGQLHNLTFKDEFNAVIGAVSANLAGPALSDFNDAVADLAKDARDDKLFAELLAEKLAIDVDGNHLPGRIGTTIIGSRFIGMGALEVESPASIRYRKWLRQTGRDPGTRQTQVKIRPRYWNVYAGETEERHDQSAAPDPLPAGADPYPVEIMAALNTNISNECAILGCDAIVDNLDEGTGAAVIQGRTGAQPADPDTATTGTNLFTCVCSDPAFGNAADDTGKATATASAITDDSSADATGTLGYCRASSTNDGATPIDDHIDGEAGTSGADFNMNTLSIVSGATVSITAWTVSLPEG